MAEYLASAPVISTRSLDEAREAVARRFVRHELVGPDDRIDMRFNAVTGRRMTVAYFKYGREVEDTTPPTDDRYIVYMTVAGQNLVSRSDGARVRAIANERGFVCSPVQAHHGRLGADAEHLLLRIPRTVLEAHLADMLGRPVDKMVDFGFALDLTTGPGRSLLRSVQLLATELDKPAGLVDMPLARAPLESYVLGMLLHAGRHQFTDALVGAEDGRRLGRLAPIVDHIEANADRELTPEILARVGHVSVRTLHAAFRDQFGQSPMAYVRKVRLGHARSDLLAADPQQVRVTDVAARWGFMHLSRFAQQYRDEFGELPAATLHR
jgi:AraC-like DNA-binding protein